jgi:choline dehydrogenase-like flavoprotein
MSERYDYVIVGAGSAGCAAAAALSRDPDVSVAVVEAGPPARGRLFEIPRLFGLQLKTTFDWDFQTEPEPALGGRRCYLPRGRVLGGTSSMNTQLYVRGNRDDYDSWRDDLGLTGWGYEDVLPVFRRQEDNERGEDDYHGVGGPLRVSNARSVDGLLLAWVEAALEAGHRANPDFNGADQEGVGIYQLTQRDGLRWSSAMAFLEPASRRPNLTVHPLTQALGIRWDGDRAVALEVDTTSTVRTIGIERELIICAGAYLSPQLLLLSGVGPADELRNVGIEPIVDLPDVGRNLRDHPGCFISLTSRTGQAPDVDTTANEELLRREGLGPMTWTEAGAFLKSAPEIGIPDLQFHAALGLVKEEGLSAGLDPGLGFGPYVCRPVGTGSVQLRSAVPYAKPRIRHNYLVDPSDQALLRTGVRMAMRIARQSALRSHVEDLESAARAGLAPASDTDEAIDDFMRANAFSFYHPAGSCSLGKVVDAQLRVHALANVRVADASVIPTGLTGNLNATAIMIGERVGDFVESRGTSAPPLTDSRALVGRPEN